jgi:lipoyl(octanoyl) transferase
VEPKQVVQFRDLGLIDYQEAWDFQEKLFGATVNRKIEAKNNPDTPPTEHHLLFCEHPHVYTLGKSGSIDHLLVNEDQLAEQDAKFYKINRGGDITYHGPGQLVAYPIFDLDHFFTDIHKYMRYLEEAVIRTLAIYGIEGHRSEGMTGVWLDVGQPNERKICAMGVKSSRWVTMHGIGFNVNSNLSYFSNIVACGIEDKSVTSMQAELGRAVDMDEVKGHLKRILSELFGYDYHQ